MVASGFQTTPFNQIETKNSEREVIGKHYFRNKLTFIFLLN